MHKASTKASAGYVRKRNGNATMSFKISNKQLLKKYNQMWKKVEKLLEKNLIVNLFMVIMINT